jgi:type II secretion system protein J
VKTRRAQRLRPTRGFTLLELLIATAVAAIVLLAINTTFFGALRLHNTTHEKIDRDLTLQRALGIVRRDLAGLMLPTGGEGIVLAGPLQTTEFSSSVNDPAGERVSPDFFTNSGKIDGWNPYSEVQKVAYFLAPATDGTNTKTLVRALTRNLLPVQESGPDEQHDLLSGVASAEIEFYDGSSWVSDWDSTITSTLPTAIKFRLVMAVGANGMETGGPLELVIPVWATTTTSQTEAAAAAAGEIP